MKSDIKNKLINQISEISKKIRGVEDFCKKIGTNPDSDVYYVSLKSYKSTRRCAGWLKGVICLLKK